MKNPLGLLGQLGLLGLVGLLGQARGGAPAFPPNDPAGAAVEQTSHGTGPAPELIASFDGLGVGFEGPPGPSTGNNPSDNSLAVGPDHIVQTVNTRMAIFTKKGKKFDTTGRVLYGAVPNNTVFKGFGGTCEARNNGDTVVRYDQLADRWLIIMPIFRRSGSSARSAADVDAGCDGLPQSAWCGEPAGSGHTAPRAASCSAAGRGGTEVPPDVFPATWPQQSAGANRAGPRALLDVLRGERDV